MTPDELDAVSDLPENGLAGSSANVLLGEIWLDRRPALDPLEERPAEVLRPLRNRQHRVQVHVRVHEGYADHAPGGIDLLLPTVRDALLYGADAAGLDADIYKPREAGHPTPADNQLHVSSLPFRGRLVLSGTPERDDSAGLGPGTSSAQLRWSLLAHLIRPPQ